MKKIYRVLALFCLCFLFNNLAKAQCAASFTYVATADTVAFTDASTTTIGSVVSWSWSFGDGGFATTQNPSHVYNMCGIYNVSLVIFTSGFCTNTYTGTVTVSGGITPSYTYTVDTTSGDVSFQGAPIAVNANYAWDFGDGSVDSTIAPTHTYPTGTYYVCLTVYDDDGLCSNTICDSVDVYVSPTACASTFSQNDFGGGNVGFSAAPFSLSLTYSWDFGDGNTGTGAFTNNTYATAGNYYVCLTAVDSATMCTSTWCDSVILAPDPTACNFTFTYFDNNGMVAFGANPPSTSAYAWDFGDGNTGTGAGTSNTYAASGVYYVCCTITDAFNGCTNTYCDSVTVSITGIEDLGVEKLSFTAYPNPVNDVLNLSWKQLSREEITFSICDVIGNVIHAYTWPGMTGDNKMSIDISDLNSGVYFVKMGEKATKMVVKTNK